MCVQVAIARSRPRPASFAAADSAPEVVGVDAVTADSAPEVVGVDAVTEDLEPCL